MSAKFMLRESMDLLTIIPQYQLLLCACLVLWISWLLTKKRSRSNLDSDFDDVLLQTKLSEWTPEPLVYDIPKDHASLSPRKVTSRVGKYVTVNGKQCLNLATHNYLGMTENTKIEEIAVKTVKKYGVGSCGPRGFYGTMDVHLELEKNLAEFMNMEEAVVYSYAFSTIASAIPAFCKKRDLVFVDEKVNFSIQKGLDASRSTVITFRHNDPQDLEKLLVSQSEKDNRSPKKASKIRRFLIVEGIYMNTGNICPLPEMVKLCRKYKLRIFVDESISFGTLGAIGKGVTEYFNIPNDEIDMIMASLENSLGSIGGFCVGSSFVIGHHRLSGLGYCFSASLPPLLTTAATCALDILKNDPKLLEILQINCQKLDSKLKSLDNIFECSSFPGSPVKHLYLRKNADYDMQANILHQISEKCFEYNLAVISPSYLDFEMSKPRPSLRICVSTLLSENDIDFAIKTLNESALEVLK